MANQKPNYISERQRYIPNVFDTAAPAEVVKDFFDYDTQMSELLAKYSLLFKCEDVKAVEDINELKSTKRGIKFLEMCAAKFGQDAIQGDDKFRIIVVKDYRGVRISRNFDEDQKILIFDENGFLVGSPTGFYVSNSSEDRAFMMVADEVMYIAFRHLRYNPEVGSDERDTTCDKSYTSSKNFHVIGVVMTHPNYTDAPSVAVLEKNNTEEDYFSDNCKTKQRTNKIPKKIGVLLDNPPTGLSAYDISRWASYCRSENNFEYGLFVKIKLEKYAEFLEKYEANHSSIEDFTDAEASGLSIDGDYGVLNNLRNIYKEIARILRDRSKFVYSIAINKDVYTSSTSEDGIQFTLKNYSDGVKGLQLKIIDNYRSFYADGNCTVTFMPRFLPEGSQFFAQSREKNFRCQLRLKRQNGKCSITSIGDNNVYGQALKSLKLFNEDHGLYAIPLISYNWVAASSDSTPLPEDGIPCLSAKAPDVMMWIDGVKMVPYIDYTVEDGSSSSISGGQYIKMRRLPGHQAAPTAEDDDYIDDDPMFPLPLDNAEYTINVVLTAQRGCSPTFFGNTTGVYDCDGILERYIGPAPLQVSDPVMPEARQVYPGDSKAESVLFCIKNSSGEFEVNAAFNYGAFKMFPVGALSDTAILHFQNGRYIPSTRYNYRVAGDRIFVSNSQYKNLQDMEFHILLDMGIPKIAEISNKLSKEEGNFDKLFRYFFTIEPITPGSPQESYVKDRMRDFVESTTKMDWIIEETKNTLAGNKFLGFERWINTSPSLEYGALNTYIEHHGYTEDELSVDSFKDDVLFDANRNLASEGFRSINVDPSEPTITGEVRDVPVPDQDI